MLVVPSKEVFVDDFSNRTSEPEIQEGLSMDLKLSQGPSSKLPEPSLKIQEGLSILQRDKSFENYYTYSCFLFLQQKIKKY